MMSKIVMMMSIITIIAMYGEAANPRPDDDVLEVPPGVLGKCPPHHGTSEYYQITIMRSVTPLVGGCAYIQHNPNEVKRQSFSLWLSNFKNNVQRCREKNYRDMEHYHFNCLIKPHPSSEDSNKGRMSVRLYGQATNDTRKVNVKCAMYDVIKGNSTMFRMAISGNSSCAGLADLLTHPKPMKPEDNNGYMLLRLNKYPYTKTFTKKQLI